MPLTRGSSLITFALDLEQAERIGARFGKMGKIPELGRACDIDIWARKSLNLIAMKKFFTKEVATKVQRHKTYFFAPLRLRGILIHISAILAVTLIAVSCKKNNSTSDIAIPAQNRTFRFELYTNQNFATNSSVINFSIFIKNAHKTLFDSSLAAIQIKDIPDFTHKIIIEKTVADNSDLAAGFRYEIPGVGISWHIDSSKAGNELKVIDYSFQ